MWLTDEFENLSISPEEKHSDDAHSVFLLFKPKVLNAIKKIRKSKKCPDNDSVFEYIIERETSNVDKTLIASITNELIEQSLIENKKTQQDLDSFHVVDLSKTGNTSTTKILQPLHPQAVENSSPDPTITNAKTPMLKSTQN